MVARCTKPSNCNWKRYGARGITVCERWMKYENFLADMGERPSVKHSIERIDNSGHYEPGNCRWATAKEQANNRRDTVRLTYKGETKCLTTWAAELGYSQGCLKYRLKNGWTVEKTLSTPVRKWPSEVTA